MNAESNDFPPGEGSGGGGEGGDAPLNTGKPAVAAAPGKMIFVILFAGIFIFIIVRSLFFSEKEEVKQVDHHKEHVLPEGGKGGEISISPGSLPQPPSELTAGASQTPPPPLPPPPPALIAPVNPQLHEGAGNNEALSKRIHSPMFVMGGNTAALKGNIAGERRGAIAGGNDPNSAFAESVANTRGKEAIATRVPKLNQTILQGKLIHAVLESAIDSDVPAPIRAIVSHDIYAESGRDILIPKGTRLIGVYNSQLRHGQARIFVVWQRLLRPDGIDIAIESPGVDLLGRGGMGGDLDNKYFEMFSAAIMTSTVSIGLAAAGDALFGNQQTTTTNNGSGSTTTESPTATAMQSAVQNVGQVGSQIVSNAINTMPTINIDQGTPINVFVNRDLVFPREITGSAGGFVD